jgi:hypothetical protein
MVRARADVYDVRPGRSLWASGLDDSQRNRQPQPTHHSAGLGKAKATVHHSGSRGQPIQHGASRNGNVTRLEEIHARLRLLDGRHGNDVSFTQGSGGHTYSSHSHLASSRGGYLGASATLDAPVRGALHLHTPGLARDQATLQYGANSRTYTTISPVLKPQSVRPRPATTSTHADCTVADTDQFARDIDSVATTRSAISAAGHEHSVPMDWTTKPDGPAGGTSRSDATEVRPAEL